MNRNYEQMIQDGWINAESIQQEIAQQVREAKTNCAMHKAEHRANAKEQIEKARRTFEIECAKINFSCEEACNIEEQLLNDRLMEAARDRDELALNLHKMGLLNQERYETMKTAQD